MNGNQARSQEKSYKKDPSYKGTVFIYMNPIIHTILASAQATLPIVIDEDGALEIVSSFSGIHITTLDACTNGSLP